MANFGFLVPTGGGEDIPLKKDRILVGRRENCDIVFDSRMSPANIAVLRLSKDIGLSRIWIVETERRSMATGSPASDLILA
jgi:hypothetical protein